MFVQVSKKALLAAACVAFVGTTASAAIVVSEDFTYADGAVEALNGGTGFSSAWGAPTGDPTAPTGLFNASSNQAIYNGNSAGQSVITQERDLSSAVTVSTTTVVTVGVDIIIAAGDTQAGRGIGINFVDGTDIAFTLGKKINGGVALFANGIGSGSTVLGAGNIAGSSANTFSLTATLTYDGTDTVVSATDGTTTVNHTFTGEQVSFDAIQLTGYHQSTTGNGVDNISVDVSDVPEPGSLALLGLGGLLIARRRRA